VAALDVIRSVTTNAAEMLGWQDKIGAIESEMISLRIELK
jgi:imidazolonepropionase-like amidohydrolase